MGECTEDHSPSTTLGSGRSIPRGYLPFVQAGTSLAIFRSLMANFSRINHAFRCTIELSPVCLSADLNCGDGPSKDNSRLIIASLEELQRAADANSHVMGRSKRRGRKSMGSEERQEVSERMKKYWAGRRSSKQQPIADSRIANGK